MNKMKKKHVIFVKCMSLFLIAVFALSFAGCSGQKDAKKATAAPTAAVTAKPTAKQTEGSPYESAGRKNRGNIRKRKSLDLYGIWNGATGGKRCRRTEKMYQTDAKSGRP